MAIPISLTFFLVRLLFGRARCSVMMLSYLDLGDCKDLGEQKHNLLSIFEIYVNLVIFGFLKK